jgi:hypothetical protein
MASGNPNELGLATCPGKSIKETVVVKIGKEIHYQCDHIGRNRGVTT